MLPASEGRNETTSETSGIANDIVWYKKQAKRLTKFMLALRVDIKHGHALHAIARIHGLKDYNTLVGMVKAGKPPIECSDDFKRSVKRGERLRNYFLGIGKQISPGQAHEFIALVYPDNRPGGPPWRTQNRREEQQMD